MASITKDQIKEAIKGMTILEVADLVKDLEKEFGVSASTPVMVQQNAMGSANSGGASENQKTEFNVVLKNSSAASKIPLIKEIRSITSLGLKEAKDLADKGGVVKENVSKEEAEKIQKSLTDLKAEVVLE